MPSDRDRALMRAKLDVELADPDIDYLLSKMDRVEGDAGVTILERGRSSNRLFFLVEGSMAAHVDAEGRRLVLGHIAPGHWIGELQFLESGASSASVTSESPFVALTLEGGNVDAIIDDRPIVASALIRTLSREIAERLAATSTGVIQRVANESYQVADAEQRQGWFRELLANLFRSGGES